DTSVVANSSASPGAPQISGCAPYSFIGQSVCVCGNFPEGSWSGIRLDGQPATITAASRHVLRVALLGSLAPGTHEITGDFAVGFSEKDKVLVLALRLLGSIDSNALLRGAVHNAAPRHRWHFRAHDNRRHEPHAWCDLDSRRESSG